MTATGASAEDEYRQAFLRHQSRRIDGARQSILHYMENGWEAGGLAFLEEDIQRLAEIGAGYDLDESTGRLQTLGRELEAHRSRSSLPDRQQSERMLALLGAAARSLTAFSDAATHASIGSRSASASDVRTGPHGGQDTAAPCVFHVGSGGALAQQIDGYLESRGCDIVRIASADQLGALMSNHVPDLLLVDASRMADLAAIGESRRDASSRSGDAKPPIRLAALSLRDDLRSRLEAHRAGVEALFFPPFDADAIATRLHELMTPAVEEQARVLIVEDDSAQALFAQGVLTKAGMHAEVEKDPARVLDALASMHPDLLLLDLHLPGTNGMELTAMIRERPEFAYLPIVFLSGESSIDARFEAIDSGGDDFLSKPIRPKNLIAAVKSRLQRMRALQRLEAPLEQRDESTGLYRRAYLFDRINDALGERPDRRSAIGGVLFLELDGTAARRDRLGIAAIEELRVQAGQLLVAAIGEQYRATNVSDSAFVILATDLDEGALEAFAERLRDHVYQNRFSAAGKAIRLRASVGICPLYAEFGDASALLDTAERTCREARVSGLGVKRHVVPRIAELARQEALVQHLREAIAGDGLELLYQPIVSVRGESEIRFETSFRMRDPNGRLLTSSRIQSLADQGGLTTALDRRVFTRVFDVLREQRDSGRETRIFVPQSMATFAMADQGQWLRDQLAAHGLPGSALVLACRFDEAVGNPEILASFARSLGNDGVQLCLAQCEDARAAAELFYQIPLAFVQIVLTGETTDIPQSLRDALQQLTDRARSLGIRIIIHRVESPQSAAALWTTGIDCIQGNIVQRPVSVPDFDFGAVSF